MSAAPLQATASTALSDADPGAWHRAAATWGRLADEIDRAEAHLAGGVRELPAAWSSGGGAEPAQDRLAAAHRAVLDAREPVRRIANALAEHAYTLAALRRLAHDQLAAPEAAQLAARVRELEERTRAVLATNQPPAAPPPLHLGVDPEQVRAWWAGLSTQEREAALLRRPALLCWLDGLPCAVRDRANRALLDARLSWLRSREAELSHRLEWLRLGLPPLLTPPPLVPAVILLEWSLHRLRDEWAGLHTVRETLERLGSDALLLGIDGRGDGRVAIALGDPDHAAHTAVFVPGANTDLRDTPGGVGQVSRLWREADAMTATPNDVAAVFWLGYDAPGAIAALGWDASREGAQRLGPFLDGLRVSHDPLPQHLTVVGHSYGSTVVAEAALRGAGGVDDIVVLGSPGMHTDHAADLLDPRHVWGGVAADDSVGGWLGGLPLVHGEEPTDPGFGANRFLVDTHGHGGYWEAGSESLRNQAAIIAGRYDLVSLVGAAAPLTSQATPSGPG